MSDDDLKRVLLEVLFMPISQECSQMSSRIRDLETVQGADSSAISKHRSYNFLPRHLWCFTVRLPSASMSRSSVRPTWTFEPFLAWSPSVTACPDSRYRLCFFNRIFFFIIHCICLQSYLHCSTCYVNADKRDVLIEERLYPADCDPHKLMEASTR